MKTQSPRSEDAATGAQSNLDDLAPQEREFFRQRLAELFLTIARTMGGPPASYDHYPSGDLRPRKQARTS
jgi:hypothetical protein